jgi:hypothetical protein
MYLLEEGPRTSNKNIPKIGMFFAGGEGGIRTREPLWVTRFPSVRAKPDYATSPFRVERGELYHVSLPWQCDGFLSIKYA